MDGWLSAGMKPSKHVTSRFKSTQPSILYGMVTWQAALKSDQQRETKKCYENCDYTDSDITETMITIKCE